MTTWNPQPETFSFLSAVFDVAEAKRVLTEKAHKVGYMGLEGILHLVGEPGKMTVGISVDWDRIQSSPEIDMAVPVILAWTKAGSLLPIDGWHRIAKAKLQGLSSLPAVVLNKKESRRCWL
jgi:hypothetical protein